MKWQAFADSVVEVWARPRVGGFPSSSTLAYIAKLSYWQATNLCDFNGTLPIWLQELVARLPKSCNHPVGSLSSHEVVVVRPKAPPVTSPSSDTKLPAPTPSAPAAPLPSASPSSNKTNLPNPYADEL